MDNEVKTWLPERRENQLAKLIAFLVSPVLGLLTALLHPNTRTSYLVLLLSFMTIGLTMIVPEERNEEANFDCTTYRDDFESIATYSSADFNTVLADYSSMSDAGGTDIYATILYYAVSRFTDNYHVCFMVIALIFAWFMLKSMRYLVAESDYRLSVLCLLLLFLFTMCQIQFINMFRYFTAYWIALYALFKIILEKDRKYWLLLAVTPFVHGAFFLIFIIYAFYRVIRGHHPFAVTMVIIGLLFSSVSVQVFSWIILHLPDSLGGHYSEYINEWYLQEINEGGIGYKWVVRLLELAVRLSVNAIVLFFAYNYKTHIADTKCNHIYFLLLALTAFVNFTFMIPDVGSRNVMFVYPLIAYIWLVCFSGERRWNWIIYSFAGMYLMFFLILPWNIYRIPCFRHYMALWNMDVVYQSPVYLFVKYIFFPPA